MKKKPVAKFGVSNSISKDLVQSFPEGLENTPLSNCCRPLYAKSFSGGFLGWEPKCETPLVHDDDDVDDLCRDETKASYSFFSPGSASRCRSGQLVGRSPVA